LWYALVMPNEQVQPVQSVCPACNTQFLEFQQFTPVEIALFERVTLDTVKLWMRRGLLKFSLVRRGKYYAMRLITGAQYLEFHHQRVRLPGDGSPAALIWDEYHRRKSVAGKLGNRARWEKIRRAKPRDP